jgi:hypothetical protein
VRCAEDPVLLEQVVNDRLLLPVDPAGEEENDEGERRRQRVHGASVPERLDPLQGAPDSRASAIRLEPSSGATSLVRLRGNTPTVERSGPGRVFAHDDICPHVFFRLKAKGRRGPQSPHPIKRFDKAWKQATIAAGCPGRIPHDFRRTAIRNAVRHGVPERVAMAMCGHETRAVFDRYNIVSPTDFRLAAQQLSGLTGTKRGQFQDSRGESRSK